MIWVKANEGHAGKHWHIQKDSKSTYCGMEVSTYGNTFMRIQPKQQCTGCVEALHKESQQ